MAAMGLSHHDPALIVHTPNHVCAIPLAIVEEIMRPLPTNDLPGMPPFVRGLAVIRGTPVPVLDLGRLLGSADSHPVKRFVLLKLQERRVALAVMAAPGLRTFGCSLIQLSRVLDECNPACVASVGVSDHSLLFVLEMARIIPEGLWHELDSRAVAT